MTKRPIKRSNSPIDPMFFIPEGVDELVYDEDLSYRANNTVSDELVEEEAGIDVGIGDSGDSADINQLETPQIVSVVSQTIRADDTGREVVDVILEVTPSAGALSYEFLVTAE